LKVTGSDVRAADDVVVNADVVNPSAPPNAPVIKAAFRVRKTADGKPIITDMQVEGIWLALSQRSDFTGFLQQHGGSLPALTDNLKMQVQQLHADSGSSSGTRRS
jgi:phospholipid transport system substrate-binding protein